jgi:MoaA/NifB/PqqE/SkfB family radical SAM enzyme
MGRVITIDLLRSCNQACGFCHFRSSEPVLAPAADVLKSLQTGFREGARFVRFTVGEPLLDRRLLKWLRIARETGFTEIAVETNATIASLPGMATRLAEAGLTRAWGNLMSAVDSENDAITRDPGGASRTWEGLRALASAGVSLGLSVAVTSETAPGIAGLIDRAASELDGVDALRLLVVQESHLLDHASLQSALGLACTRARKHRMDFRFEPVWAPPPCAFDDRFVAVHTPLYASFYIGEGDPLSDARQRVEACATCAVQDRCPGFHREYLEKGGRVPSEPIGESARVALKGQLGGIARHRTAQMQMVQTPSEDPDVELNTHPNIRVNWACNQRCRFCWVDFDWTPPTREVVFQQIDEVAKNRPRWIVFTGGEPTLVPWLSDVIAHARSAGIDRVRLQTNAVHAEAQAGKLAKAGLSHALVSLHGHVAEISDAVTQAPDTFERSVRGIDALLGEGVEVSLSHVITSHNQESTRAFADFVADRWKGVVEIVWSVAAPITEATDRYEGGIVAFDTAGPALMRGLERCLEREVPFGGHNDTCGVPRCVLQNDPRFVADLSPQLADEGGFTHPPVCDECLYRGACRGVRTAYAEAHGGLGLQAIVSDAPSD